MAEKERSFGNWAGNVAKAPGRVLHTGGLLVSDAVNTTTGFFQDILNCVKSTKDKIIDCFSPDKKRYQKILNIPVAAGIGIVGAVETAVKPVVNGVTNTGKTALNATTNTWKSTFGSIFSAKPVSDFSFNTVKTKKGTVNVNTENRVMDTNKPWTINRGNRSKKKKVTKAAAGTATVAGAATAAAENKLDSLQKSFEEKLKEMQSKMNEMKNKFDQQIQEVLTSKKELEKKNKLLSEANAQKDEEIDKLKAELQGLKKNNEKNTEPKPEVKSEPKPEKKDEEAVEAEPEKKEGKKEKNNEKKSEGKEIKENDRFSELIGSNKGKKMVNYLQESHPEIKIELDSSTDTGHLYGSNSGNKIVVGSKKKEDIPQILLHEISHVLEQDNVKGMGELKDYIKALNDKYGKQLFSVSNNEKYDTGEKKSIEDVCEIIAMYARSDGSFEKHMKNLKIGENTELAKISDSECETLRSLCEKVLFGI